MGGSSSASAAWWRAVERRSSRGGRKVPRSLGKGVDESTAQQILRRLTLLELDQQWSDQLAYANDERETVFLGRLGGLSPIRLFEERVDKAFTGFLEGVEERVDERLEELASSRSAPSLDDERLSGPASTWTYLVDDNPFKDKLGLALAGNVGFAAWAAFLWPLLVLWALIQRFSRGPDSPPESEQERRR